MTTRILIKKGKARDKWDTNKYRTISNKTFIESMNDFIKWTNYEPNDETKMILVTMQSINTIPYKWKHRNRLKSNKRSIRIASIIQEEYPDTIFFTR